MTVMQERIARRKAARRVWMVERWPGECPTCFSPEGEDCRSINGLVNTGAHSARYGNTRRVLPLDYTRWPCKCPVCKAFAGEHCVSLHTGRRAHDHRKRRTAPLDGN